MMIKIIDNYLPQELFDEVRKEVEVAMKSNKFRVSSFFWKPNILENSPPVLIYETNKVLAEKLIDWDFKQFPELNNYEHVQMSKTIYFWSNGAYIPWHEDAPYSMATTLYLNLEWNDRWGGYFMWRDEDNQERAVLPQANRLVFQKGGVSHQTTEVKQGNHIPFRISLQTFIENVQS